MNIKIFNDTKTPLNRYLAIALCAATALVPSQVFAQQDSVVPDTAHDCLIEPLVLTDVGSPTQGIVARLMVDRGAQVTRGQPVVELESSIEQAVIEQAEARADMQGEVATREADLSLARLDSKRFIDLHSQKLAPAQQRDEAVAREQIANAALVQALENRQLQLLELKRTRRALEQRTIRSPVDGVVVSQLVYPGELVFDNPVMTIAQLDPLRVEVVLPARLFGTVEPGDTARIFPELESGNPMEARVEVVDPLLDARSGTFGVRLLLPNAELLVPAGQKCRVSFNAVDNAGSFIPARKNTDNAGVQAPELGAAVEPYNFREPR